MSCASCRFWDRYAESDISKRFGDCRYDPPRISETLLARMLPGFSVPLSEYDDIERDIYVANASRSRIRKASAADGTGGFRHADEPIGQQVRNLPPLAPHWAEACECPARSFVRRRRRHLSTPGTERGPGQRSVPGFDVPGDPREPRLRRMGREERHGRRAG